MAAVLKEALKVGGTTMLDHGLAFGNGIIDGYVLTGLPSGVWIVLIKNVIITLGHWMFMPLPTGLVLSAESTLGFILGTLLAPKKK